MDRNNIKLNRVFCIYATKQMYKTMGRYYNGDISGKFWFAVQGSADISNLINIKETNVYRWYGCNCRVNEPALAYKYFCTNCYDTQDEFLKYALPHMESKSGRPYEEVGIIYYDILADDHLSELEVSLYRLKSQIHKKIMDEFDKIENDLAICNASSGVFDPMLKVFDEIATIQPNEANPDYVARYRLGLQVKYQLVNKGSCYVSCEI